MLNRFRRFSLASVLVGSMLAVSACASQSCATFGVVNPVSSLSPAAQTAFHNTQAIKALDQIRDIAEAANSQSPPVVSTDATRRIVLYHLATIKAIHESPNGWKAAAMAGLDDVIRSLSPSEQVLLDPYISLVKTILQVVS